MRHFGSLKHTKNKRKSCCANAFLRAFAPPLCEWSAARRHKVDTLRMRAACVHGLWLLSGNGSLPVEPRGVNLPVLAAIVVVSRTLK